MIQKLAFDNELACEEIRMGQPFGFHSGSVNECQTDLPSTTFTFEQIKHAERLEEIRTQWERLLEMAVEANAFYQPEFLIPAYREFADDQTSVIAIWAPPRVNGNGEPVLCGLLPIKNRRSISGLPCNVIEFWKHEHTYLTTPLLRRDVLSEAWNAFADWVDEMTNATLLHLPLHSADGVFHRTLIDWILASNKVSFIKSRMQRALFLRNGSTPKFMQEGISRKKRHELNRALKRLRSVGEVGFTTPRSLEEVESWGDQFLDLEQHSWKGARGTALKCQMNDAQFWKSLIRESHESNRLMALGLTVNNIVIAAKCNLLSEVGGFAFKIAFDPTFSKFSPGALLEIENIHQLHESWVNWLDSCASANHPMIDSLWPDRRVIESICVSTKRRASRLVCAGLPICAWAKHLFKR